MRQGHTRGRRLGELPETLSRERQHGRYLDPSAGLYLDWSNRFTCINFGTLVGLASQTVLQDNGLRTYLMIQNNHAANVVYLAFNSEATVFSGVRIIAGGNYELIGGQQGGAFVPKSSINLLASGVDTNVVVVEGALEPEPISRRL